MRASRYGKESKITVRLFGTAVSGCLALSLIPQLEALVKELRQERVELLRDEPGQTLEDLFLRLQQIVGEGLYYPDWA